MPTQKKVEAVEALRAQIERAQIVIAASYSGLSVTEMSALRRAVRDSGDVHVVKNRLFLRAANEAGRPELAELLEGPTAVIFGFDDVAAPAKAATEYQRTARNAFAVRKGALDGQVLSLADIEDLANLPSKPQLIARLAGGLQSPIAGLAGLLKNVLSVPPGRLFNDTFTTFAGLIEARANQLEA